MDKNMIDVREAVLVLCDYLKYLLGIDVDPENIRLAKFNKQNENTVKQLWQLLFKLCCELDSDGKSNEDVMVEFVKYQLFIRQYCSKEFYCLSSDMIVGSRELLLALGWLIATFNILENIVKQKVLESPINKELGTSKLEQVQHHLREKNLTQTSENYTNYILWTAGRIHQNLKAIKELDQQRVKLISQKFNEDITHDNTNFIKEVVHDTYGPPAVISGLQTYQLSPLKQEPLQRCEWKPTSKRTGVITKKIGCYPMWLKDGTKINTTLLQVVDNHVIRYIPPEEFNPVPRPHMRLRDYKSKQRPQGCLLVGAESTDPQEFTKEYCGLFKGSGVMPKRTLGRFFITADAAIQPGTPLYASHFNVGDVVDVIGKTVYRGFEGVMKRHGFKGQPASHGATKTHRRPGNIGGGGEKGRVWPGTKLPGHMGNRMRYLRGLKIWRINTKYNVLYVQGLSVAGETNSIVYVYDTLLPRRKHTEAPNFPTFYPEDLSEPLPEDIFDEEVHPFAEQSISFS